MKKCNMNSIVKKTILGFFIFCIATSLFSSGECFSDTATQSSTYSASSSNLHQLLGAWTALLLLIGIIGIFLSVLCRRRWCRGSLKGNRRGLLF